MTGSCPLCRSPSFSNEDCPTCVNSQRYHANVAKDASAEEQEEVIQFPGPARIEHSPIYGNYLTASRFIPKGDLIIKETPISVSAYAMSDTIPVCLSCYKDIALSCRCSKCKWPVCGPECENSPRHADNECPILASTKFRSKGTQNELFCIETLRCLLLRERCPPKWKRILQLQPHVGFRSKKSTAKDTLRFISNFIRNVCGLGEQYDEATVDHVVGVVSVNTFWGFKDMNRYSSILFDKVSLFAHDCDPNTTKMLHLVTDAAGKGCHHSDIEMRIHAARDIDEGEMLSIHYVPLDLPVKERRADLLDIFYFHCTCNRCLDELLDLENMSLNSEISEEEGVEQEE